MICSIDHKGYTVQMMWQRPEQSYSSLMHNLYLGFFDFCSIHVNLPWSNLVTKQPCHGATLSQATLSRSNLVTKQPCHKAREHSSKKKKVVLLYIYCKGRDHLTCFLIHVSWEPDQSYLKMATFGKSKERVSPRCNLSAVDFSQVGLLYQLVW